MPVYVVAQINIHDRARYAQYEAGFMSIFEKYNGTMLAVDEATQTLEGAWNFNRSVIIEFPTDADARAWYQSEEYQNLAQHRFAASDGNITLIAGMQA